MKRYYNRICRVLDIDLQDRDVVLKRAICTVVGFDGDECILAIGKQAHRHCP